MPMKKLLFKKYTKGFTLIELLVVIAIIGILTAIITANLTGAKSKARDAKRISDLAQIQLTLEQVFDRCGKYPQMDGDATNGTINESSVCTVDGVSYSVNTFISQIPTFYGTKYNYFVNNNGNPTDYILKTKLENNNVVLIDDIDNTDSYGVSVAGGCGENTVDFFYCVVPK